MIHDTGNRVLDGLERRLGHHSFPLILRWIAGFQVLTWALSLLSPGFLSWIAFDQEAIWSGQVWRLFTWVLFPAAGNVLFVLFAALIMFFVNDGLEGHWGSFRLNVFVFSTVACLSVAALLAGVAGAGELNWIFFCGMFLAFASLFPDQTIHFFGIIPIKAKWLGWMDAALLGATALQSAGAAVVVIVGLLPYLGVFVPAFRREFQQRGEAAVRRHRFQENSLTDGEAFHRCDQCGATEHSNPEREFRVAADGNEYCNECRTPEGEHSSSGEPSSTS